MMPPIFIVGCDRSGTTLLRLMLSSSPELHVPAETGFIPELWARRGEYGDFSDPRGRWFFIRDLQHTRATSKTQAFEAFGLEVEAAEAALADAAPTDFAGAVAALYATSAAREGKGRWGDKTPSYILHMSLLAVLWPGSRFVHIIRDPRDVAASMMSAGWRGSYGRAASFWRERVSAGRSAGRELGPGRYREIHYERLVRDPEAELRRLGDWLGLPFTPKMLDFHEHSAKLLATEHRDLFRLIDRPTDASRAFAWKRALDRAAIAAVEAEAGGLMADVGYDSTGLRLPLWTSAVRWGLDRMMPLVTRLRRAGIVTLPAAEARDDRNA